MIVINENVVLRQAVYQSNVVSGCYITAWYIHTCMYVDLPVATGMCMMIYIHIFQINAVDVNIILNNIKASTTICGETTAA